MGNCCSNGSTKVVQSRQIQRYAHNYNNNLSQQQAEGYKRIEIKLFL